MVPPSWFKPKRLADLISSEGMKKIDRWLRLAMKDLVRMHELGSDAGRMFNEVCAIGQNLFKPEARGVVWDLRRAAEGIVVPLDYSQPIHTHLNLDWIREQMDNGCLRGYQDQEILSQLLLGVRYKDKVDLQLVLIPHLISFGDGCVSIQRTKEEQVELGWYSLHKSLPYAPARLLCHGATEKGDDYRETTDGGQPRHDVVDTDRNDL